MAGAKEATVAVRRISVLAGDSSPRPVAPDPSASGNADVPGPEGWGALVPADRSQGAPEEMRIATTPRSVAQQMAQQTAQISALAGGRVDLRLDPEELGRVAMQIHTEGDRITLIIAAERGDTTELIRRHLQELAEELRALGYRYVSLGFEDGRGGDGTPPRKEGGLDHQDPLPPGEGPSAAILHLPLGAPLMGLDLRL